SDIVKRLIFVERPDLIADSVRHGQWISSGSRHQLDVAPAALEHWQVHFGVQRGIQPRSLHVTHHADDLAWFGAAVADGDPFAEWVFVRKEFADESLAYDRNRGGVCVVMLGKVTPFEHRRADCPKIVWRDLTVTRRMRLARRRWWTPLNRKRNRGVHPTHRNAEDCGNSLDSGE